MVNMPQMARICVLSACLLGGSGCFTRTVYVPSGKSVRLRQDVTGIKIWAKDADGKLVPGKMTLKEGWFVVPKDGPVQVPTP